MTILFGYEKSKVKSNFRNFMLNVFEILKKWEHLYITVRFKIEKWWLHKIFINKLVIHINFHKNDEMAEFYSKSPELKGIVTILFSEISIFDRISLHNMHSNFLWLLTFIEWKYCNKITETDYRLHHIIL